MLSVLLNALLCRCVRGVREHGTRDNKRVLLWVCRSEQRIPSSKSECGRAPHTGLDPRRAARIGAYQETGRRQRCRHAPMTRPPSIAFIGSNSIPFHPRSVRSRSSSGTPGGRGVDASVACQRGGGSRERGGKGGWQRAACLLEGELGRAVVLLDHRDEHRRPVAAARRGEGRREGARGGGV